MKFLKLVVLFLSLFISPARTSGQEITKPISEIDDPKQLLQALLAVETPWLWIDSIQFSGNSLIIWANTEGNDQEIAMARFMRFVEIDFAPENTYDLIVSGNEFFATRMHLSAKVKWIGLHRMMKLYNGLGRYEKLLEITLLYCEIGKEVTPGQPCQDLAKVYYDLNQFDKAIHAYRINADQFISVGNFLNAASSYNDIGSAFEMKGNADSAFSAYDRALSLMNDSILAKQEFNSYQSYFRDIIVWNRSELRPEFVPARDMPEKLQNIIKVGWSVGELNWPLKGYKELMRWHYRNANWKLAATYCDSALYAAEHALILTDIPDLLRFKGKLLAINGELNAEFLLEKKANKLQDSLQLAESQMQGVLAAAFHNAKEREQELNTAKQRAEISDASAIQEKKRRQTFSVLLVLSLVGIGFIGWLLRTTVLDRRLIRKQRAELKLTLGVKDDLLKEIHHRVKNNLQVISTLLDMQGRELKDEEAKNAITEGQIRVRSIALIHQNLYQHDDLKGVEFGSFFHELSKSVKQVFMKDDDLMELEIDIPNVILDIDTAVPLGLISNELLTNCCKYGASQDGVVRIYASWWEDTDGRFRLTLRDRGAGMPSGIDLGRSSSLGLRLVNRLSEQLGGDISYYNDNGSVFVVNGLTTEARKQEE